MDDSPKLRKNVDPNSTQVENIAEKTANELSDQIKAILDDILAVTDKVATNITAKIKKNASKNQKLLDAYQKSISDIIQAFVNDLNEIKSREDIGKFPIAAGKAAEDIIKLSNDIISNFENDELFDECKSIVEDGTERIFDKVLGGITIFQARFLSKLVESRTRGESSKTT